ncbi:MAG: tRNA lysidine(34) synthetase TilS [Luminiphilus sp.]|nr:tRNA lysidine(34) synthetase TilS [Luminiphilus sp.]
MLQAFEPHLATLKKAQRLNVALSGGVDSLSLLVALCRIANDETLPPLNAIHVNHQLQPDADRWADRCAEFCRGLGVELTVRVVSVIDSGKGPEAAARQARYDVFESLLMPGDLLLMGHHQDDQAETLMLRLLRGAGPRGLSAIPESRVCGQGVLLRPLLQTPRSVIEAFAASESLLPITDSSNSDTRYDRNFIRHEVLPVLEQRWPSYRDSFTKVIDRQRQAAVSLMDRPLSMTHSVLGDPGLELNNRDAGQLAQDLYQWLEHLSATAFSQQQLIEFARQCVSSEVDKQPSLSQGEVTLTRWRGAVYAFRNTFEHQNAPKTVVVGAELEGHWGVLDWLPGTVGLRPGVACDLSFRTEGLQIAPWNRPTRPLSQWFQEMQVPPFRRDQTPLLCIDGAVVAVCNLGLTSEASAYVSECDLGMLPRWRPAVIAD